MSERFSPYEPDEAKEPPPAAKSLSPEGKAGMQGGPEATKPGDLNHPMEGKGEWRAFNDGHGRLNTPEMEQYFTPGGHIEREPGTYRTTAADPGQAPGTTPPNDSPSGTPAPTNDTPSGNPPPPNDNPPDPPPLKAPHFDRRPMDQINDVPRPMTETPDPGRGRRSMQGHTDEA